MEVVKPWEDMEMEAEETEVALRGRMPRQLAATDDEDFPPIIAETLAASKVVDRKETSSDESESSSSSSSSHSNGEKKTNGNGVSHAENGSGDAKSASANGNGHSGLDSRYLDFLDPPLEAVSHGNEAEIEIETAARDLALPLSEPGPSKESESIEYMEARLRKRIEEEFKELYLNKLSDKPGNHEFYCPNCKACITKVLVKEQDQDLELKPSLDLPRPERVDGFRCASCFAFLIPIGNWLFPSWSVDNAEEPEHDVAISFGGLREPLIDHSGPAAAVPAKTPESSVVTSVTTSMIQHSSEPIPSGGMTDPNQQVVTTVTTTITGPSEPVPPPPRPWSALIFGQKNRAVIKDKTPVPKDPIRVANDTDKIWDSNGTETPYDHHHQYPPIVSAVMTPTGSGFETGLKLDIALPFQDLKGSVQSDRLDQSNEDVLIVKTTPSESKFEVVSVSRGEMPTLQEIVVHGAENQSVTVQGIIDDAEPAQTTAIAQGTRDVSMVLEPGSANSWEIIKSIVYGGLVESITSLGIVTSAASGDATTLNIVALALANLIGGLFVIAHNIWELRDDKSTVRSSLTERMVDKYQDVLGKRDNFYLHATVAILSFIIFGLIPPVTYGLAFRESGDKDLKLAAVGSAALACIALLAIMKAYVQRPNKYFKTVVYYFLIAFAVSGASYVAGDLISKLLKNIESSDSTPPAIAMSTSNNTGRGFFY